MWVLTREENEYDQYGHYFVAVFEDYPSPERLQETIGFDRDDAHILHDYEILKKTWLKSWNWRKYRLVQMEPGEIYTRHKG
jgi:hypothetical protein